MDSQLVSVGFQKDAARSIKGSPPLQFQWLPDHQAITLAKSLSTILSTPNPPSTGTTPWAQIFSHDTHRSRLPHSRAHFHFHYYTHRRNCSRTLKQEVTTPCHFACLSVTRQSLSLIIKCVDETNQSERSNHPPLFISIINPAFPLLSPQQQQQQ